MRLGFDSGKDAEDMDALTLAEVASLPALITPSVAARILDVSDSQMRVLCASGRFKSLKPGKADWRIVTASLLEAYGLEDLVEEVREKVELPARGSMRGRVFVAPDGRVPVFVPEARRERPVPRAEGLPETLTVQQAARALGRSEKTLRRWAREGRISARKTAPSQTAGPKGSWVFSREDVVGLALGLRG